jgi:putative ATP-dependent endonuclease of OLD family
VTFEPGKKEKLQRYLNVTRAELFFARRLILVEGTAELFLLDALATKAGYDLRKHSVSIISTDGLNFDAFLPLFGKNAMQIPVAVVTDADPPKATFPDQTAALTLSDNAKTLKGLEDEFVKCYFAKKTLEYDLAFDAVRRELMVAALKEMHPKIGADLETDVGNAATAQEKAKVLYCGMFQRPGDLESVQKGRYSQVLAYGIATSKTPVVLPPYLEAALNFVAPKMDAAGG